MDDTAERLLEKVRHFADSLEDEERPMFAALIAPGVAAAWNDEDDVAGFGVAWQPSQVQDHLREAIRTRNLRVEGW